MWIELLFAEGGMVYRSQIVLYPGRVNQASERDGGSGCTDSQRDTQTERQQTSRAEELQAQVGGWLATLTSGC